MNIDRRVFLSASFLALVARAPAIAAMSPPAVALNSSSTVASQAAASTGSAFYGNPNTSISAISLKPGFAMSKTAGQVPCFVQVSAAGITCTGTRLLTASSVPAVPYEDLEFTWNFGDPQGGEIFVRPTDGVSVNANVQVGPEAVYCYRKPGIYTVTLTIRGKNGSSFVAATTTQSVTVSAFTASAGCEYWVDSVNGLDSNSGTSASRPKKSLSFLQSGSGGSIPNWPGTTKTSGSVAIHLAQGSHWVGPSGLIVPNSNNTSVGPASNLRIDSFVGAGGPGPKPIIEVTGTTPAFNFGNPGSGKIKTNIVVSDVKFTNSGAASAGCLVGISVGNIGFGPLTMMDMFLDGCVVSNTLNIPGFMNIIIAGSGDAGSVFSNFGIWGGAVTGTIFDTSPKTKHAIFGGPTSWWFVVGPTVSGSGANPILDHHIYPETQFHSLYKWITFGPTGTTANSQRNYCINTNVEQVGGTLTTASYFLISENSMSGTKLVHDMDNSTNDLTKVQFINFVTERNAIFNVRDVYSSPEAGGILFGCGLSLTVRDNRVWNSYGFFAPFNNSSLSASLYRNRIYVPASSVGIAQIQLGCPVFNMTAPAVSNGSPILFLNNGNNTVPVGTTVTLSGALPSPLKAGATYYVNGRPTPGSTCTVSATPGGPSVQWDGVTAGSGNIVLQPHIGVPQWITDNIIHDERASPSTIQILSSDLIATKSLIDRNQYWKSGASNVTPFFYDSQAAKTLPQWQIYQPGKCFDENGRIANPSWTTPPSKWSDFGS